MNAPLTKDRGRMGEIGVFLEKIKLKIENVFPRIVAITEDIN